MIRAILLGLCLSFSAFSSADEFKHQEVSLKELFKKYNIGRAHYGIPINNETDIFNPQTSTQVRMRGVYPVEEFAASANGKYILLGFHAAEVPENSGLEKHLVLASITDGVVTEDQLLKAAELFKDTGISFMSGSAFITDSLVRFELNVSPDRNNSLHIDYGFYDLTSKQTFRLSEVLGLSSFRRIRALTKDAYLVDHGDNKSSIYWLDQTQSKASHHVDIDHAQLQSDASYFIHAITDETDLFTSVNGDIFIHYGFQSTNSDKWESGELKISADGKLHYKKFGARKSADYNRVQGQPDLVYGEEDARVFIVNANAQIVKEWSVPSGLSYSGRMQRVKDGYIFEHVNHPQYGFVFFKDDGSSLQLTSPTFRLIHSVTNDHSVMGLDAAANFHSIVFSEDAEKVKQAELDRSLVEVNSKKYKTLATMSGGRYIIAQISDELIGVLDKHLDEQLIHEIVLFDSEFKVKTHANSLEIIYPAAKARDVYSLPRFKRFISDRPSPAPSSSCKDALK